MSMSYTGARFQSFYANAMTPLELACRTGRSAWTLEEIRDEMTDEEWHAYCEGTLLDATGLDED